MEDKFKNKYANIDSPVENMFAVTPSDSVDLAYASRGIYVGVSGDVQLKTINDDVITLVGLAAGVWHPIRARRIYSTSTTATDIVAGY